MPWAPSEPVPSSSLSSVVRLSVTDPLLEMSDDEDEILVSLAEVLGSFTDFVGGAAHALSLVKPLEPLACAEEAVIRDEVDSYATGE